MEVYPTEVTIDVFCSHEIAHALHYQLSPSCYFFSHEDKNIVSRKIITEGLATLISMTVMNVDEITALWGDYITITQKERWEKYCKKNHIDLINCVISNFHSISHDEILFFVNNSTDLHRSRTGYYCGLHIISQIKNYFHLSLKELMSIERQMLDDMIMNFYEKRGRWVPSGRTSCLSRYVIKKGQAPKTPRITAGTTLRKNLPPIEKFYNFPYNYTMKATTVEKQKDELAAKMDVLVLLSGGIDSTALIHFYKTQGNNVSGLFIDFGQISGKREYEAAERIAKFFKIKLLKLKCPCINSWKDGYIPGRNAFLLHTALMNFQSQKGIISIGIHSGTNYVDCTQSFAEMMQQSFDLYTDGQVNLGTPFINWKKNEIYYYSKNNDLPLHLTYSCEMAKEQPCGECKSCKDLEALNAQR